MNPRDNSRIKEIVDVNPQYFTDLVEEFRGGKMDNTLPRRLLLESFYWKACMRRIIDPNRDLLPSTNILEHPDIKNIYSDEYVLNQLAKVDLGFLTNIINRFGRMWDSTFN